MTLILGFSFSVSLAQKQSATSAKPVSDEQRKQARAASNANESAAFSDAIKSESVVQANPANVNTTGIDVKKGQLRANAVADVKPVSTEKSAAEIAKKKAGQNAEPIKKIKGN